MNKNSYKKEVEKIVKGKGKSNQMVMVLKCSPYWMTQLGYAKYPILIGPGHIASALNIHNNRKKHYIDTKILLALPKLLKKPIAVCNSYSNRIEIYINATDKSGRIIIVCLEPETKSKIHNSYVITKLHYINSIYGKDNSLSIISKSLSSKGLLYPFDKTKKIL